VAKKRRAAPRAGEPAPDFTLLSTSEREVTLSSYRGGSNVILAFFPLAFTTVCAAELGDFSQDLKRFEGLDAVVLGISVDSVPALQEFRTKEGITIPLLSDFKRDVCRRYGTLLEDRFFSKRAYFIVDKEGIVRWTHTETELGHKRENAELLAQLEALG
jgi:peroxiredoxin